MEKGKRLLCIGLAVFFIAALMHTPAFALSSLSVVDETGAPVAAYRWLLELDTTHPVTPGVHDDTSLGVSIHRSYAPIVARGDQTQLGALFAAVAPGERYYLSVLPSLSGASHYTLSGAPIAAGQAAATVTVINNPLPTAQILVLAFEDNRPLNAAPDTPAEAGLENFQVLLFDQAGQQMTDAFGNNLGTTYQTNPDGSYVIVDGAPVVLAQGNGIFTDVNGEALIKNIAPGKYGVRIVPTSNDPGGPWVQTSTIEGTPGIDAWVKAGEPPFLQEFGFLFHHVFIGFVHPTELPPDPVLPVGQAVSTVTGQAVMAYSPRGYSPAVPVGTGGPVPEAWIGLTDLSGTDNMVYAAPADPDTGAFTINNVPPGIYQLVVWDANLDVIITFYTVITPPEGGAIDLGLVPANMWFGNFEGSVFYDANENGVRDPGEEGIPDQAVLLRFVDGSIYQATATTPPDGEFSFNEVFPFFKWLVAEVDFARFKATGATFTVDDGAHAGDLPGTYNPMAQYESDYVSDATSVLLPPGPRTELGPVLLEGIIVYADQHNYADFGKKDYVVGPDDILGTADDIPGENGGISGIVHYATTRAEDDPRFAAAENWEPGIPNVPVELYRIVARDASGKPSLLEFVDAAVTDSWDASQPTGCFGDDPRFVDCSETLQTWNQMRPTVWDGGYAFDGLMPGEYVVKIIPPVGYEVLKYGDRNVDFGDEFIPNRLFFEVPCVGAEYVIPPVLSLDGVTPNPAYDPANPTATAPLCDMKEVILDEGENPPAEFFLFSFVPKAARAIGLVTDDLAAEPDPNNPRFGDKQGAKWIPISFQDFQGHEVNRVYTDEYGAYNALLPSTYTVNVPNPTGVSPNMLKVVLNHPGFDPANPDPFYNPSYTTVDYTLDFWPGKITYLDTPVLRTNPFNSIANADCEPPSNAPVIAQVNATGGGPYVAAAPDTITITAVGDVAVRNPAFDPTLIPADPLIPPTIVRHYGFGATQGTVTLNGTALPIVSWTDSQIQATVPAGSQTGQLLVTNSNGLVSKIGITLHVRTATYQPIIRRVPSQYTTIQAAIDAALPPRATGTPLILVAPGLYAENLIMWKKVKLQGYGAGSTIINGSAFDPAASQAWESLLNAHIASGDIVLINGQDPLIHLDPGAVITVASKPGAFTQSLNAVIDGFTLTGANRGGGVLVNAYAPYLQISNNRIIDNEGNFGGGIRIGTPSLVNAAGTGFNSSQNANMKVHHNQIFENGAFDGGGGLAIFNGANNYIVSDNCVCGNFSLLYGGGMAHFGLSDAGLIDGNEITFNQAFDEGGGMIVAGELVPAGAPAGTLTPGSGDVTVNANKIIGNISGDDGGGIMTLLTNGQDVTSNPSNPANWHELNITNNIIANNVSADGGGGMALDDTANIRVIHNTIADNDSTSTGVDAFGVTFPIPVNITLAASNPLPAGILSKGHSTALQAAFGAGFEQTFVDPVLYNNIIYNNRSWYWDPAVNPEVSPTGGLVPRVPPVWDLGVLGIAGTETLNPMYCELTALNGYSATNITANPLFKSEVTNALSAFMAGALGNFITLNYTAQPLASYDYHLQVNSPAIDTGTSTLPVGGGWLAILDKDVDREDRDASPDRGADEVAGAAIKTVTLSPSINPGVAGTQTVWTTTVTGGTGSFEYYYWVYSPAKVWAPLSAGWQASNTINWTPGAADVGSNLILVQVRTAGSTGGKEAQGMKWYQVGPGATLTPSVSPATVGSQMTWTATVIGPAPQYQFRFWQYDPAKAWNMVQDWGTDNTWEWTPVLADQGSNLILVQVRTDGSAGGKEGQAMRWILVNPAP